MAVQLMVHYRQRPVVYDMISQESDIFHLHLNEGQRKTEGDYVPQKIVIRKKGKIWISDAENYRELVEALTAEIIQFRA